MTEETKLNCSVNHNYREGYQQGREDEQKRFIKILVDLFGDEPCNFNDMDECTDGWCECFCGEGNRTVFDCWEHAINSGWIKEQKNDSSRID